MKKIFNSPVFYYGLGTIGLIWIIFYIAKRARKLRRIKPDFNRANFTTNERVMDGIALQVYNALSGIFDWTQTKIDALEKLNNLNDDEFSYTVWVFNRDYADKCITCNNSETLRDWINSEGWGFAWSTPNKILSRMDQLQIP